MPRRGSFTVEQWLEEIDRGLDFRRKFGLEDLWGTIEAVYYNVDESMMNDGPNILLSQGDAMLSMISVPSPRVIVRPSNPDSAARAHLLESLDNVLIEDISLSEQVEHACLNAYLFGRGILKIGYDSEWGYSPEHDLGGINSPVGISATQFDSKGYLEYNADVVPGMPWVKSVLPHDIVVPWGTYDVKTAPWIAHRVVRHIDDLKADEKYDNTSDLRAQISMEDFVNSYRTTMRVRHHSKGKIEYVELYEIHDRKSRRVYVVTRDHGKFLRNEFNSLQIDNRLPFTAISFTPRTRSFWTTPDAYYLIHVQNELSDLARQRSKHRRISTLKFLYDESVINEQELAKILSPDVGVAAKINSGFDITRAVLKLENNPNQFLALEEDLLRANAREQIGFSRNQLGEYSGGRKTATEVMTVDRSSQLRMSRRGVQVKRLYEETITILNNVIFDHWTLARYVPVMGADGAREWALLNGPSLMGRYTYSVDFADDVALEARRSRALQLFSILSQDPNVDPVAVREYLLSEFNDPKLAGIYNADVRRAMQERKMPSQGGGIPMGSQPPSMSEVRGRVGENGQQIPTIPLAP